MANNINRLGFNITGYNYTRQEETAAQSEPKQREQVAEKENKKIAASDVLSFMAATNADMIPVKTQKTVDVNKYVTPEQAERITGFMKNFEADYEAASRIAIEEFGVGEKAANEIALAFINFSYK